MAEIEKETRFQHIAKGPSTDAVKRERLVAMVKRIGGRIRRKEEARMGKHRFT